MTMNNARKNFVGRCHLLLLLPLLGLFACDINQSSTTLTPATPLASPMVLGVTHEPTEAAPLDSAQDDEFSDDPDSSIPPWTLLFYITAENEMADVIIPMLEQLTAASTSDEINIVIQIDWPNAEGRPAAARYQITAGEDLSQWVDSPVAILEEVDSGAAGTLSDFINWGTSNYPARNNALFLGPYGGGWQGCCLDTGQPTGYLDLAEIEHALGTSTEKIGRNLDLLAFNSSLMGQLDVLVAAAPYVNYLVASPTLIPGLGWDYENAVGWLSANPHAEARDFASQLVSSFDHYRRQLLGDSYVSMAAFDLANVTELATAVETLALTLNADPARFVGPASDARRAAQIYGIASSDSNENKAAVDLHHAAAILAQRSPAIELEIAARAVTLALERTVLASLSGDGLPDARGLAIYWPEIATNLRPNYLAAAKLPHWTTFLQTFTTVAPAMATADITYLENVGGVVSSSRPELLAAEVVGRQISALNIVSSTPIEDGRNRILHVESIQPPRQQLDESTTAAFWEDGRHRSVLVWSADTGYLYDSAGTTVDTPLRSANQSESGHQLATDGSFRRASAGVDLPATVTFPVSSAVPSHVWHSVPVENGNHLVGEIDPLPGDLFVPDIYFMDQEQQVTIQAGDPLIFDDTKAIYRSSKPLIAGTYHVGLSVHVTGGRHNQQTVPIVVEDTTEYEDYRSYVDPEMSVEFIHPADWSVPIEQSGVLITRNISDTARMQVWSYEDWSGDIKALQEKATESFGDVTFLHENPTQIGGVQDLTGQRFDYGYQSSNQGARSGVLILFIDGDTAYAIDVDAPLEAGSLAETVATKTAASWRIVPDNLGLQADNWTRLSADGFTLDYPTDLAYQEQNGWYRLAADPTTFIAIRQQPAGRLVEEAADSLLATAANDVSGFATSGQQNVFLAGREWLQTGFSYTTPAGQAVNGTILVTNNGNQEFTIWAEEPHDSNYGLLDHILMPIVAGLSSNPGNLRVP